MKEPPTASPFLKVTWRGVLALASLMALLISIAVPNFNGDGPSKFSAIINNLRQIDGAVQYWAVSTKQTGAAVVTWADIAPYIRPAPDLRGSVKQVAGERYVLKALPQSPEAVLTRRVEEWPKGTLFRFATNGDPEIIPPNKQGGANGRQQIRPETNRTSEAAASRRSP